jgi:hypothetical protein
MIEILQWSTLALCAVTAAARIPSALRGQNRAVFYIFALLTVAILLSIEAPYVAIDQALGGINVANLILRYVIFAAIFFVGIRVTRGFGAVEGHRFITGRIGISVLALISVAVLVLFLMMDTAGSSAGMAAVSGKDARNGLLAELYGAAGRAYPAYASLALLPAMVRAVRSRLPAMVRFAAFLPDAVVPSGAAAVGHRRVHHQLHSCPVLCGGARADLGGKDPVRTHHGALKDLKHRAPFISSQNH